MKKITSSTVRLALLSTAIVTLVADLPASAQVFTPGDLVVSTYGSASSTSLLDGDPTPITLNEYVLPTATSATLMMADQLPTSGTGGNVGIVGEYGSSSEGTLLVSGDGNYLTIGGYDGNLDENGAPSGGYGGSNTAEAQSTDTNVPRVAALVNLNTGSVNTSTVLNDIYNTNNPRGVYSPDGTTLYLSGQGASSSDQGGIYKTTVGTNTTAGGSAPTAIYTASSTRTVSQSNINASNGTTSVSPNTYVSIDQSSRGIANAGIFEYTGSPTSSQGSSLGTRITAQNNGLTGSAQVNYSPQGFAFANATTLYVADTGIPKAGGTGDGGIQKWSFSGGTWSLDYTLTLAGVAGATTAETGFEALTLKLNGNSVSVYGVTYTSSDAAPNGLYGFVDNLSSTTLPNGEALTELEKGSGISNANGQDQNFKGVAFVPQSVPEPSTWVLMVGGLIGLVMIVRTRNHRFHQS